MTTHVKHSDTLDVQIRTKILDQYGNPIEGAIEYDPSTGYGKRIKDARLGLIEDFYIKDGSIEIDGQNFDDTNHDPDQVDAIRTVINMKINRSTDPQVYEDNIKHHADLIRKQKQELQKIQQKQEEQTFAAMASIAKGEPTATTTTTTTTMIAADTIRPGDKVIIDDTGAVRKFNDNIFHASDESRKARRASASASAEATV